MAEAAKLNNEETPGGGKPFSLPEPVSKLGEYPRRLRSFLHDVRVEMRQVNWPSRQDVRSTTIVVTVTVAFFGAYFGITDKIFGDLYYWVSSYFRHH